MILSTFAVILVFSAIIIIHELGHFIFAKRAGVKVEKFSVGFGPKIFGIKKGETEFVLSAIPFGGYVKMAGEFASDGKGKANEFLTQPPGKRGQIIFAGAAFNYILAYLIFVIIFMAGQPLLTNVIGSVMNDYPAKEAGLLSGDEIIAVDGKTISNWDDLTAIIYKSPGQTLELDIERQGELKKISVTPIESERVNIFNQHFKLGLIGISPVEEVVFVKHNLFQALKLAFNYLIAMSWMTLKFLYFMITGAVSAKAISGPVGISVLIGRAAHIGLIYLLQVMATISMSLAIINLLPIPALDGGHLLFLAVEKVRKRPVSLRVQEILNNAFFFLLISLMLLVTWNDIARKIAE